MLAETSQLVVRSLPTGHADRRTNAGRRSQEEVEREPLPIARAASGRNIGEPATTPDAGEPRPSRPWIVPVSPEGVERQARRPTTAADSPAAPWREAVERKRVPTEDARLGAAVVPSAPSKQPLSHAPAGTRQMAANTTPDKSAAMPDRAPLGIPPDEGMVPVVPRDSRPDSGLGNEPKPVADFDGIPEPIVAPQHALPHPPALPVLGRELPRLAQRSAPPTVRVTIGRIEVRAALPAQPAATRGPPSPRRPALSLDDYLKRRNGESR